MRRKWKEGECGEKMCDLLLLLNQILLCSQVSKLPEDHMVAPPWRGSNSRTTHFPSTSPSTTQHTLSEDLPQPLPRGQAHSPEGSIPPHLTSTLEHIVSQLDILTQVRTI